MNGFAGTRRGVSAQIQVGHSDIQDVDKSDRRVLFQNEAHLKGKI